MCRCSLNELFSPKGTVDGRDSVPAEMKGRTGRFSPSSILGIGGSTAFLGLLLFTIWIACGFLMRFSFATALNKAVEIWLSKYVPGGDTYKAKAEEKMYHETKILPYSTALIKTKRSTGNPHT